jgi:ribonuclease D
VPAGGRPYTLGVTPWIRTREELQRLTESLRGCRAVALDSESDSLHHHFEKVCLVQLATDRGEARLLDPLALKDLSPLASFMADPTIMKVLHGADYDVTTLKRDFGFVFAGLFDTMIAARFLGLPEIGLAALVRAELGVALTKDSQKDDWSVRPLTPIQEAYALADVEYLLALHARLVEKLKAVSRLEWVLEESGAVGALPAARKQKDPEGWQHIKGARRLSPRSLAVLRELYAWREARAEATDVPAFKILGSEALLALAEKAPRTVAALGEVRGVLPRLRDQASAMVAAVSRAIDLPGSALPAIPREPRPILPEAVRKRVEALKAWRTREAVRAGLDVSVILPQRLIDKLAEAGPRDAAGLEAIEGLRRWRIAAYGREILGALERH